jgi:hypothetical protein
MNAEEGGGAVIQARSSFFAGMELTTGGCNSFTGGMFAVGVYIRFGFSGGCCVSTTQAPTPTLDPFLINPGGEYTISCVEST